MNTSTANLTSADPHLMNQNPSGHESNPSQTDGIAISATDLIRMINSGQGRDVNDLVSRMLQDRQAA